GQSVDGSANRGSVIGRRARQRLSEMIGLPKRKIRQGRRNSGASLGATGESGPRTIASAAATSGGALGDGRALRLPIPSAAWRPPASGWFYPAGSRNGGPSLCV